ncbi:MAG: TetR/AcrR family transcriptional regulator [Thiolinea sp.]
MFIHVHSHNQEKPPGRIRQRNEKKIIAAAEIEFAQHGFKGASIQNIAKRAGLPKANVHYYFSSKLELYGEILAGILELWDGALSELKAEDDPATALHAYICSKIEFSRHHPLASRIFSMEIMSGGEHLQEYYRSGYVEWFRERTAVFQAWIDQGKMTPVDPAHLMFLLWSSTQHYADFSTQIQAALGNNRKQLTRQDYEDAARTLSQVILTGCGIHRAPDPPVA